MMRIRVIKPFITPVDHSSWQELPPMGTSITEGYYTLHGIRTMSGLSQGAEAYLLDLERHAEIMPASMRISAI